MTKVLIKLFVGLLAVIQASSGSTSRYSYSSSSSSTASPGSSAATKSYISWILTNGLYQIEIDVQGYSLNELTYSVANGFLNIKGKQESGIGLSTSWKTFSIIVSIPVEVNSKQLNFKIGSNGFLIITAPPLSGSFLSSSQKTGTNFASSVQGSSPTMKAVTSVQYETMSLRNGLYYLELDVQNSALSDLAFSVTNRVLTISWMKTVGVGISTSKRQFTKSVSFAKEADISQAKYSIGANGLLVITVPLMSGSSPTAKTLSSQSSLQYQTMSLVNGIFYVEVDVQGCSLQDITFKFQNEMLIIQGTASNGQPFTRNVLLAQKAKRSEVQYAKMSNGNLIISAPLITGTLLTNANKSTAGSYSAGAAGVQESSTTINTSTSDSTRQYQTMSLVNGTYYMEVDVQGCSLEGLTLSFQDGMLIIQGRLNLETQFTKHVPISSEANIDNVSYEIGKNGYLIIMATPKKAAMEQGSSSLTSAALSQSSISIAGSVEPKNADSWLSYKNGSYYLTVEAQGFSLADLNFNIENGVLYINGMREVELEGATSRQQFSKNITMLEGVNTQKLNYEMNQNGQIIITAKAPLSGSGSQHSEVFNSHESAVSMQLRNGLFYVEINIEGFILENLKFELTEDNLLIIHGGRLVRNGSKFTTNYFERSIIIPKEANVDNISYQIGQNGYLILNAPHIYDARGRTVIHKTGSSTLELSPNANSSQPSTSTTGDDLQQSSYTQRHSSTEDNLNQSSFSGGTHSQTSSPLHLKNSSHMANSQQGSTSNESDLQPSMFLENNDLEYGSSSEEENSIVSSSKVEAISPFSSSSEEFQLDSSYKEIKSPSENTLQPCNSTVNDVNQFSSSFTGLASTQIIPASEKGSPQSTLPHHTSSIAEASKASKSTTTVATQSGLSSKASVLVWNNNTKGKNTKNNLSLISNMVQKPAGTMSTSSQKTQVVTVADYPLELSGSETQKDLKSNTKYISKNQYHRDVKTEKYPSQKSSQAAVQTGGLSKTYYQGTNNGNGMYQSFNKQTKSYLKPKEYLTYNTILPVNAQMQEGSDDTAYKQFNNQEYQQQYMDNNVQDYQQPFQGWIDTAQEYQQPHQDSSIQYQYSQTNGVNSGFVPAWKTSYTPVSGNSGCYNKCRPDCNEYVIVGFCEQSCQTACNILPTCGIKNNVQYTGQTMVCGRQGYNSEQIINGYYITRPMNLK